MKPGTKMVLGAAAGLAVLATAAVVLAKGSSASTTTTTGTTSFPVNNGQSYTITFDTLNPTNAISSMTSLGFNFASGVTPVQIAGAAAGNQRWQVVGTWAGSANSVDANQGADETIVSVA